MSTPHALPTLRRRKLVLLVVASLCAAFWWQLFSHLGQLGQWIGDHVDALAGFTLLCLSFALLTASLAHIEARPVDEDTLRRFGRDRR